KLPLLRSFAENITYAGAVGSGHALKLLHNFVSLGTIALIAEAAAASDKAGIEPAVLHGILSNGGGGGVALDRLAPFMLEGDAGKLRFTLSNAAKDLDYYAAMAAAQDSAAEIAGAVRDTYRALVDAGKGGRFVPEMIDYLK